MANRAKAIQGSKPSSSYAPAYDQIPRSALLSLAKRYELGEKKHGRDNWRGGLSDKKFVVERINHIIDHAKKLQDKINGYSKWDKDDDVGAILWGGALLAEAMIVLGYTGYVDPTEEV